ncbi:MAG TPA: hypothetical protein DIS88_08110 [Prevotella sp.]|nr:hypothetical protein [Prevotella sp.]
MKNLKNYLMLFACLLVASMTLTSCMNDDDNTENYKVLTQAEKSQVMMAVSGTYTGKMKYYSNSTYNSADSVSTSWRITSDSTFVMQFPMEAVEGFIDGQDNKSDIASLGMVTLKGKTYLGNYMLESYWTQSYYQLGLEIESVKATTASGKTVTIEFSNTAMQLGSYSQVYYPMIEYYNNQTAAYILIKNIDYEGMTYPINAPFMLGGKK